MLKLLAGSQPPAVSLKRKRAKQFRELRLLPQLLAKGLERSQQHRPSRSPLCLSHCTLTVLSTSESHCLSWRNCDAFGKQKEAPLLPCDHSMGMVAAAPCAVSHPSSSQLCFTLQASDKRKALEETMAFSTQSLASVAYQVSSLATTFLQLLDLQAAELQKLEANVSCVAQVGLTSATAMPRVCAAVGFGGHWPCPLGELGMLMQSPAAAHPLPDTRRLLRAFPAISTVC